MRGPVPGADSGNYFEPVGAFVLGVLVFREVANPARIFFVMLIGAGIAGLKLVS